MKYINVGIKRILVLIENIFELNQMTINVAKNYLNSDGIMIMKTFQNNMLKTLRKEMQMSFKVVQTFKPVASKKTIRRDLFIWSKIIL
jgi:23S rRNA U2552 (ribose-2'-O)-methylase RlmE/FtsJ